MRNNKGFSLVELIVVVAILAVFGSAIIGFIFTGTNSYKNVSKDSELQYNAQLCINQVENLIIDASKGLGYSYKNEGVANSVVVAGEAEISGTVAEKVLTIYNNDYIYLITWKGGTANELYLQKNTVNDTGAVTATGNQTLLAAGVNGFSCSIDQKNSKVKLGISFIKADISYSVDRNITLRNGVIVNGAVGDMYQDPNREEVREVKLFYGGQEVTGQSVSELVRINGESKGEIDFTSKILGKNIRSQEVIWQVAGNSSDKTKIENGKLTISAEETNHNLSVTAIAKSNTSKSASAQAVLREVTGISFNVADGKTEFFQNDLLKVTASVSGVNLTEEDSKLAWSAINATRTNTYEANSNIQEFSVTGEAGNKVKIKVSSAVDAAISAEEEYEIQEDNYAVSIGWKGNSSASLDRAGRTEAISAAVSPDKGQSIKWELSVVDSKNEDVTDKALAYVGLTSTTGKETSLTCSESLDFAFAGKVIVRAYVEAKGEKIYSNAMEIAIKPVEIKMVSLAYNTPWNTALYGEQKVEFWRETKSYSYEISGYAKVNGAVSFSYSGKDKYFNATVTETNGCAGEIQITATKAGTGYIKIRLNNKTVYTMNIVSH